MIIRAAIAAVMAVVLLPASVGLADEPDYTQYAPEARPHVREAMAAFARSDYATSVREWEAAYALDRNPVLLYSWAQAERFANRCGLAIDHYTKYLQYKNKLTDNQILAARGGIAMCLESINKTSCDNKALPTATTSTGPTPVPRPSVLPWYRDPVGGAVIGGVAGIGIGIGFLLAAGGSRDRADAAVFSDDFAAALDEATTRRRIGLTALTLGTLLGGAGVALYLQRGRTEPDRAIVGGSAESLALALAWRF